MNPSLRHRPRAPSKLDTGSRRLIVGAGLAVALGVFVGWALFHGGEEARAPESAPVPANLGAGAITRASQYGLRYRLPAGWVTTIKQGVLNIAAPDKNVSVTLAMTPGRPDVRGVRRDDRRQLKELFKAREVDRRRYAVGPLRTLVTELQGRTNAGREIRILSMGVSSKWRTYSVQVFSAPQPTRVRALELQGLIASFKFDKPR